MMRSSQLALLLALQGLLCVRADENGTDENNTEVQLSPAPTMPPTMAPTVAATPAPTTNTTNKTILVTTFAVSVKLTSIDAFDVDDFIKGMAKAMGVDDEDVKITETFFAMSTILTFANGITKEQLNATAAAVADANSVDADQVTLSIVSRRLRGSETRRLGSHEGSKVKAKILIPTSEKAMATYIKDRVASPLALAEVAKALGVNTSALWADSVEIAVEAKTVATITGDKALAAPSTKQLLDGLKEVAPGKTFEVQYIGIASVTQKKADTMAPTPAPTDAPVDSGAPGVATLTAVAATMVALVLA
eukprot:TRINITY_DN600_c0_g1_i2.p1 TRINITY_DN600_c0_g1~~TRINITY_DN600_c0_g1_i2.p1  ORF type:complete len:326 (+),score=86.90 TRINITY_DN600_c0_g1_i2:61-978(+)